MYEGTGGPGGTQPGAGGPGDGAAGGPSGGGDGKKKDVIDAEFEETS
jgi:hypothetical protein